MSEDQEHIPKYPYASADGDEDTRPGHLGKTWELGVVIAIVIVVIISVATAAFSYRRRQRKRRLLQQEENLSAVEAGRKSSPRISSVSVENQRERLSVLGSGSSSKCKRDSQSQLEIAKPSPSLSGESRRSSRAYPETPSQKPPKYYWTER